MEFACDMPPRTVGDNDAPRGRLGHACATARQSRPIRARAMRHTGHQDMSFMEATIVYQRRLDVDDKIHDAHISDGLRYNSIAS